MISCRDILNSDNSSARFRIYYSCMVFTTDINNNFASSTGRNFYNDFNRFALFSLTYSNINWSIIFRTINNCRNSSVSMSIITGINNFNSIVSRNQITDINNSSTVNNCSIELFISNFNSHITSSIITNNNHDSSVS